MKSILSIKKKFIIDGVFFSELNEFLCKELSEEGYANVEIRKTPLKIEIILKMTQSYTIMSYKGRRIGEISAMIKKRFNFGDNFISLFVEKIINRGLSANSQAELLRYKLVKGIITRKACYSILRSTMESGAKGCLISVSGKIKGQRAKTMKFIDGYIIHSGQPVEDYVEKATRHCFLKQGMIGVKISIMLPWDPVGTIGPKKPLPDVVTVLENRISF
ncbi:40S ribosomal protein S3 (nucleomorph) [Chroomonas mesostigmatica CCMP1168]|uniref:40S ribosomal protein S3 n=1 Tax=Chroomonas mesostigmatica CCMP1168 TaxID=1195612 RepID=J7G7S0_9CRYP|nr:40S ribosomal protein S3 [Chroomonas mesostigmatica CCMP1168]|mmetsp:Transcript_38509/g.94730  ORF Transcript_38509/g.94730 Transcript_38509/m.94730 type:complete len:218 (-) Transcript_38509:704-1357(-)